MVLKLQFPKFQCPILYEPFFGIFLPRKHFIKSENSDLINHE